MSVFEIQVVHVSEDGEEYQHWLSLGSLRASGGFSVDLPAGTLSIRPFPQEALEALRGAP